MVRNGDAHLKNFGVLVPSAGPVRLSTEVTGGTMQRLVVFPPPGGRAIVSFSTDDAGFA